MKKLKKEAYNAAASPAVGRVCALSLSLPAFLGVVRKKFPPLSVCVCVSSVANEYNGLRKEERERERSGQRIKWVER